MIIQKTNSGFTVVELLLSLAILAMLLTAIAVAFDATADNYTTNANMARAMNTARQSLLRITSQLRTAVAVATGEANSQCSFVTSDNQNITYQFNSTDNKLYLVTNDDTTDADYVLCENVTAMTFDRSTVPDSNPVEVRNVQISMTVTVDDVSQNVATAAVIRKNL